MPDLIKQGSTLGHPLRLVAARWLVARYRGDNDDDDLDPQFRQALGLAGTLDEQYAQAQCIVDAMEDDGE